MKTKKIKEINKRMLEKKYYNQYKNFMRSAANFTSLVETNPKLSNGAYVPENVEVYISEKNNKRNNIRNICIAISAITLLFILFI